MRLQRVDWRTDSDPNHIRPRTKCSVLHQTLGTPARPNRWNTYFRSARSNTHETIAGEEPLPQGAATTKLGASPTITDMSCAIGTEPPNVQDEPRPGLARLVLLGARGVTAPVVGSGVLLDRFIAVTLSSQTSLAHQDLRVRLGTTKLPQ